MNNPSEKTKRNWPLAIALIAPFLMIAIVALLIYLPGLGKFPQKDFIYATGYDVYYGSRMYAVQGGHLIKTNLPNIEKILPQGQNSESVVLFYKYNVKTNTASEITFEEAQKLNLDPSKKSVDGYEISQGLSGGGGLFFGGGRDYENYYIRGYNRSKKLNLKLIDGNYSNFQFLGWVN
jgi:hypothetical protein